MHTLTILTELSSETIWSSCSCRRREMTWPLDSGTNHILLHNPRIQNLNEQQPNHREETYQIIRGKDRNLFVTSIPTKKNERQKKGTHVIEIFLVPRFFISGLLFSLWKEFEREVKRLRKTNRMQGFIVNWRKEGSGIKWGCKKNVIKWRIRRVLGGQSVKH